jgi:hypothetical protein
MMSVQSPNVPFLKIPPYKGVRAFEEKKDPVWSGSLSHHG